MEPFSIIFGVWGAIMATISAFSDGKRLWKSWREKRRLKKQAANLLYTQACESPQMPEHSKRIPSILTQVAGIGQSARSSPFAASRPSLASRGLYDPYEGIDHLDDNLTTSPRTVQNEYTRLSNATGPLFRQGDDISFRHFRDGLSRFKNNLMQTIRQSIAAITIIDLNVSSLMGTTNIFRHDNVNAMTGLFQRVNVARPIPRTLNPGAVPVVQVTTTFATSANDGSNCWCRQAAASSSLFVCPFCGSSSEASL